MTTLDGNKQSLTNIYISLFIISASNILHAITYVDLKSIVIALDYAHNIVRMHIPNNSKTKKYYAACMDPPSISFILMSNDEYGQVQMRSKGHVAKRNYTWSFPLINGVATPYSY